MKKVNLTSLRLVANHKALFFLKCYLLFCLYYHSYWFFFDKSVGHVPMAPIFFPILKDLVWISFVFVSFIFIIMTYIKPSERYSISKSYKSDVSFIIVFFSLYFAITLTHFHHKNSLDIFQHNIRNIIGYSPIFLFLPFYMNDNEDIKEIYKFLVFNGAFICAFGVLTKLFNFKTLLFAEHRVLSTMGNPNNLAFFVNILIFTTLSKFLLDKKMNKKLLLLLFLFILCILFTISVTNMVALVLGSALIFLLTSKVIKGITVIMSVCLLGIVLFNLGFLDAIILKCDNMFDENSTSRSYFGRVQQVHEIGEFLKNKNSGSIAFGDYSLKRYRRYDSQYWNILRNDGLLLLICFILILISIIRTGLKKADVFAKRREYELSAILMGISVSFLTVMIVSFNGTAFLNRFPLNFLLYLFMGLILLIKPDQRKGRL